VWIFGVTPLTKRERQLTQLLLDARKFHNQVVRDSGDLAAWHVAVDRALTEVPGDDPRERYDDPARAEHREFVRRMLNR